MLILDEAVVGQNTEDLPATEEMLDQQGEIEFLLGGQSVENRGHPGWRALAGRGPLVKLSLECYLWMCALTELTRPFEVQWWVSTTQQPGSLEFILGEAYLPNQTCWRSRCVVTNEQFAGMHSFFESRSSTNIAGKQASKLSAWCHTHLDHDCGVTPSEQDERELEKYAVGLPGHTILRIITHKESTARNVGRMRADLLLANLNGPGSAALVLNDVPIVLDTSTFGAAQSRAEIKASARASILKRVRVRHVTSNP